MESKPLGLGVSNLNLERTPTSMNEILGKDYKLFFLEIIGDANNIKLKPTMFLNCLKRNGELSPHAGA
jgi:hypothetical protein